MAKTQPKTFEDNIGVRIVRLAEVFTRLAKLGVEQPWGLRSTDLRILNVLDGEDSVPINEISRRTHVDKAWISRSVRKLEEKKLVKRKPGADDSRMSLAALTVQGRELLEEIRPPVLKFEQHVLENIDPDSFKCDLDQLLQNAETLLERAETLPSKR